jgi:hypothetical protein
MYSMSRMSESSASVGLVRSLWNGAKNAPNFMRMGLADMGVSDKNNSFEMFLMLAPGRASRNGRRALHHPGAGHKLKTIGLKCF